MVILLQVQINIVLAILLIILLGHAYFNMNRKKTITKLFMGIIELNFLMLILEIFSVLLNSQNLKQFMVLHKLVDTIGFMVSPSILYLGYMFSKEWVNRYQKEKVKANNMMLIPLVINGVATVISWNEGWIFYITRNNIYERGPLFFILPCVCYIYFAYNLYFIYKHRKKFIYLEFVMFSLCYMVPAMFTIVQLKYFIYLTSWSSAAIVTVVTYIFILNNQAYQDSLTGLENRLAYERYVQNINCKRKNKLFMLYIDIDEFKTINDQYGHCQGDEALKDFANLLVDSFSIRQKKVIRLGGDEFLILLEEDQPQKVEEYIENLTQNLKVYNESGEQPYRLGFSYGMAGYTNAYENIYELLQYTDKLMYEQKQNKQAMRTKD